MFKMFVVFLLFFDVSWLQHASTETNTHQQKRRKQRKAHECCSLFICLFFVIVWIFCFRFVCASLVTKSCDFDGLRFQSSAISLGCPRTPPREALLHRPFKFLKVFSKKLKSCVRLWNRRNRSQGLRTFTGPSKAFQRALKRAASKMCPLSTQSGWKWDS